MRITDHLKKEHIFLDADLDAKLDVLKFISEACAQNHIVTDPGKLNQGLIQREHTMSTGVGRGIAFPHTTSAEARQAAVILIRLAAPMDFDALDNQPVDIVLALIFPASDPGIHVRMLARVSRLCQNVDFLNAVRQAATPDQLMEEIKIAEYQTDFH